MASFDLRAEIKTLGLRLVQRSAELGMRMERLLAGKNQLLVRLRLQLDERSPLRVLDRGYAICTDMEGKRLAGSDQVGIGAEVNVQPRARAYRCGSPPPRHSEAVGLLGFLCALCALCGESFSRFNTEVTESTKEESQRNGSLYVRMSADFQYSLLLNLLCGL